MAGRQNTITPADSPRRRAPAVDPEARENQMIALAIDAAEKDLLSPSPSKQIVVHYLKLATVKTQLEKEKLAISERNTITAVTLDDGGYTDIMF